MLNLYPNLPGILTEFKDGGLQLRSDPNPPATESILLLGTAVDGPVGTPVAVDATTAEVVFGKAVGKNGLPNGATLMVGFEEAWQAGCRDVRMMRISGKPATALIECDSFTLTEEKLIEEAAGTMPGNISTIVDVASKLGGSWTGYSIVPESISITADGFALPAVAYSASGMVITINENVCSAGAALAINCVIEDSTGVEMQLPQPITEVAQGSSLIFTMSETPVADSVMVYADGEALAADKFSVAGKTLTVAAGAAALGAVVLVRYLANVITSVSGKGINIATAFGGNLYNESKFAVEAITSGGTVIGKKLKLFKPEVKKATSTEPPLTYSSLEYPTLESMVRAINSDPNNNIFRASVDIEYNDVLSNSLSITDANGVNFTDGDDEIKLSKNRLYELLGGKRDANGNLVEPGAYQLLENYTVDWIVPLGVFADDELPDPKKNFAQQLAMACAYISVRQHTAYGVIATRPVADISLKNIDDYVNKLLTNPNNYFVVDKFGDPITDSEGKKFDIGEYVHVLAGPDVILRNSKFGAYTANSAAVFAAMMSTMRPGSSPLNKQVPGVVGLRYTFSNSQRDRLTAARFVTYKTKNNGAIVAVEDSMTCAQPGSDYTRTTTCRAVKAAVDNVKDACDPFLGEPNNVPNRNAMSAAIDKRLLKMKEAGDINDYRFNIIASLADQVLGRAKIELTIVPPFELRQITVVVNLTPAL